MIKSPAFQFYPKDFLMDDKVAVMNLEQIGAYMKLMCFCWNNDGLPNDKDELKSMCGNPETWETIWKKVSKCFYENNGKLYNKRLEKERKKQEAWREKSKLGGERSAKSRRKKAKLKGGSTKAQPPIEPKVNTPSSSSSPSSNNNRESKDSLCLEKFQDEDIRLTQLLIDLMVKNNPNSSIIRRLTPKRQEGWIDECRKLREIDERTPEQIEQIIIFSQNDPFWKSNILSIVKLREKFDQLWLKAKKEKFSGIKEWLNEP